MSRERPASVRQVAEAEVTRSQARTAMKRREMPISAALR